MFSLNRPLDEGPFPRQMGNKSAHALKLQEHLYNQMLAQSEFCDVTLHIGEVEMKAHWTVLVSCPYFQSLYDSGMKEKQSGNVRITIGKTAAVRSAVTFLYTGQLEISYQNVRDLLEVADYFQIEDLKAACASYLMSVEVTVANCVGLCLMASLYDLNLYNRVYDFLRGHLPEVMQQAETLTLTADSVMELLKDTSLNYVTLEDFFTFIVKWVEHDKENRKQSFGSLFCELDLKRMSQEFLLNTVEVCPLVQDSTQASLHVLNVKMKHMTGLLPNEANSDVVLLVGGCGTGEFTGSFFSVPYFPISDLMTLNNVYGYIVKEDRWTELAPLPYTMRRPLVTFNNGTNELFVYDASSSAIENEVIILFKYNILEKSWNNVRVSLPENCNEVTVQQLVCCGGRLYLLASGRSLEDSAARSDWSVYLIRLSEDAECCQMKWKLFPRSTKTQVSACVVDSRYVCVLGFKCGTRASNLASGHSRSKIVRFQFIDSFFDKKSEYSRGAGFDPLILPMNNELIVTKPGAYKYRKFSFTSRRWTTVKEMLVPLPTEEPSKTDYVYTVHNGHLMMFGGKKSKKLIDNACSFNLTEKDPWTSLQAVPKPLMGSGVTVAQIPKELIRCHIDCPHCFFHSLRSQASYHIEFENDEDDEDDYSDMDDEIYSDYWDDEVYENMLDYDWF